VNVRGACVITPSTPPGTGSNDQWLDILATDCQEIIVQNRSTGDTEEALKMFMIYADKFAYSNLFGAQRSDFI